VTDRTPSGRGAVVAWGFWDWAFSWGILGILVVILTGLAVLLRVKPPQELAAVPSAFSAEDDARV
jgi:hypothetical protein